MQAHFVRGKLARILFSSSLLACLSPSAFAQQPKKHQATGTIVSATAMHIVLLRHIGRNKVSWAFATTSRSVSLTGLNKGARVTIYYHVDKGVRIADRWKVVIPAKQTAAASAPPPNPPNPKPPS